MKSSDMLACGEDLGMVPDCVRPVCWSPTSLAALQSQPHLLLDDPPTYTCFTHGLLGVVWRSNGIFQIAQDSLSATLETPFEVASYNVASILITKQEFGSFEEELFTTGFGIWYLVSQQDRQLILDLSFSSQVLNELGLLGLRIQRYPSTPGQEFGDPAEYNYMMVSNFSPFLMLFPPESTTNIIYPLALFLVNFTASWFWWNQKQF
jgi:hypothetical protein